MSNLWTCLAQAGRSVLGDPVRRQKLLCIVSVHRAMACCWEPKQMEEENPKPVFPRPGRYDQDDNQDNQVEWSPETHVWSTKALEMEDVEVSEVSMCGLNELHFLPKDREQSPARHSNSCSTGQVGQVVELLKGFRGCERSRCTLSIPKCGWPTSLIP